MTATIGHLLILIFGIYIITKLFKANKTKFKNELDFTGSKWKPTKKL